MENALKEVRRISLKDAMSAATTRVQRLSVGLCCGFGSVLDFEVIRGSAIRMGVDPLGGAGVHYWSRIAEVYRLQLSVVSEQVDPTLLS